jgi:2-dehydropantoate 2-reductase
MTFVVVGAGGIGCYIGGRLAAAGETVVFVGRSRVLDPIRTAGLTVSDLSGFETRVTPERLTCVTSCLEAARHTLGGDIVILLCVKGPATVTAAGEIAEAFGGGITVVSMQNGVDNVSRAQSAAPRADVVAGMVPYNVAWLGPTHVHRGTGGVLCLADTTRTRALVETFTRAGIPVRIAADMVPIQWGKLLVNLNNPVNALSGVPLRDELADRNYRRAWARLIAEGLSVLRKAGIEPAKVLAVPPATLVRLLPLPNAVFRLLARRMARVDPKASSSMADDLRRGRPTEIDDICGAIVRLGQRVGVDAPVNARTVELIASYDGNSIGGAALLRDLTKPKALR